MRIWIVVPLFLAATIVLAQEPATAPSTEPDAISPAADSPIRRWYSELTSPDSTIRDSAQTDLMGLSRAELSELRWLIQHDGPPAPAQVAALHDIVMQIYLASQAYPADPFAGFLGLSWPQNFDQVKSRLGVPVVSRLPGCPAFRWLRDGDLILGVQLEPRIPMAQEPVHPTPSQQTLQEIIEQAGADRQITLDVLRQGQRIRVSMQLRPRPLPSQLQTLQSVEGFLNQWQQDGEAYWQSQFVPLLHPGVS